MEDVKRIPYGISNFVEVVEQNQYYVDKTMYLPLLEEQPSNLFFIRPRRFGKSIFLSMLRAYYDIAQKEKFDKRFGNLWIGSHPTPMQGQYQVLYLDFSRASGGNGSLAENFDRYCSMAMDVFGKVYEPWYDNYCFAEESLGHDPKIFNCDMVLYYLRNYMTLGKSPKEMIDPNTRTDYNKMKRLIQLDKLDGNRKGVLRKITEEGQIVTNLITTFPATQIANPEIFPSLLFYYGMLTITAKRGNYLVLSIPNNNVRKQYYEFLLEEYQDKRHINLNDLGLMFYDMAYDGHWRESLEFIANAYKENSSVRSAIEGERNIQGFFTAYLSVNAYYLTAPEVELNHGYCDLFLMPDLLRYEVKHSYILELKYLSSKDTEEKAETQWKEAVEQIKKYAAAPKVRQLIHDTKLHCIVMQIRGSELKRMEEVQ